MKKLIYTSGPIPTRDIKISVERIVRYYVEVRSQFGIDNSWIIAGPLDTHDEAIAARRKFINNQRKAQPE